MRSTTDAAQQTQHNRRSTAFNCKSSIIAAAGLLFLTSEGTALAEGFSPGPLGAGYEVGCGILSPSSATCWGIVGNPPSGTAFKQIAAGSDLACAVRQDSNYNFGYPSAYCWGISGGVNGRAIVLNNPPTVPIVQLTVGDAFACALTTDYYLTCWGDNSLGQLNHPSGLFGHVSAGDTHACALASNGSIACWGDNGGGKTNAPSGTNFLQVSAGGSTSCALANDLTIQCWGQPLPNFDSPPSGMYQQISVSGTVLCGVEAGPAHNIVCVGHYQYGETSPPPGPFSQVATGSDYVCGLHLDGSVECWGYNIGGSPPAGSYGPQPNTTRFLPPVISAPIPKQWSWCFGALLAIIGAISIPGLRIERSLK